MVVKITATDANTARTWNETDINNDQENSAGERWGDFVSYAIDYHYSEPNNINTKITFVVNTNPTETQLRDSLVNLLSLLKSDKLNNSEDAILKRVKVEYTNYKNQKFSRVFDESASQKFLSEGVNFDDVKIGTEISVTATATQGGDNRIIDSNSVDSLVYIFSHPKDYVETTWRSSIDKHRLFYSEGGSTSKQTIAKEAGLFKSAGKPAENRLITLTVTIDGGEDRIASRRAVSKYPGDSVTVTVKSKDREPLPQVPTINN